MDNFLFFSFKNLNIFLQLQSNLLERCLYYFYILNEGFVFLLSRHVPNNALKTWFYSTCLGANLVVEVLIPNVWASGLIWLWISAIFSNCVTPYTPSGLFGFIPRLYVLFESTPQLLVKKAQINSPIRLHIFFIKANNKQII